MSEFKIDDIVMPRPSEWVTKPKILTRDSERLIGSGRLVAPYLGTVYETTWTYKYLDQFDYMTLYDAYILSCERNKSIEHDLETLDSNTGEVLKYRIYTQDDFQTPLYRIKDGIRYYTNVTFTFVGVGGGE